MKRVQEVVSALVLVLAVGGSFVTGPIAAQQPSGDGFADRLYVIDGGVGHAGNAASWLNMMVPPGTPKTIGAPAHLIKHGDDWMMFDTSTSDIIADMPEGVDEGVNGINWRKTPAQTIEAQLKSIGISPLDVKYVAISHAAHDDHSGNIYQFKNSIVLIQRREYVPLFANGALPQQPSKFRGQIFPRNHPVSLLDGDYDVFGDGSVILFYVGGHTPGSQVALVRLRNTGYVLLSGDAVHLRENWNTRRIPRMERANEENNWLDASAQAYDRIAALLSHYKAQLWINHDYEDYKDRKKAPQYYD